MKKIIGVRFKKPGKIYFFDPGNLEVNKNDNVIVETTMGEEIGIVVVPKRKIQEEKLATPLKKVIRVANKNDLDSLEKYKKNRSRILIILLLPHISPILLSDTPTLSSPLLSYRA